MNFTHYDLGNLGKGRIVEIERANKFRDIKDFYK